jgi:hypothetical protein
MPSARPTIPDVVKSPRAIAVTDGQSASDLSRCSQFNLTRG